MLDDTDGIILLAFNVKIMIWQFLRVANWWVRLDFDWVKSSKVKYDLYNY